MFDIKNETDKTIERVNNCSKDEFKDMIIRAGGSPKELTLEDKVINALNSETGHMGSWELANAIWNNCMNSPKAGNGARIAHLRRIAQKSDRLHYHPDDNGFSISIKKIR